MAFQKGLSGNPRGREPGSRNRATLAMQALLDGEAEALTRKCVELALDGDTTALKLAMDRLLPPRRTRTIELPLPALKSSADVSKALATTIGAVASGSITPDEASAIAGLLEAKRKVIETEDLEARIGALEAKAGS